MKMYVWQRVVPFVLLLGITGSCAVVGAEGYRIQAGAYSTLAEAEIAADRLAAECSPLDIQAVSDGSQYPYKVRVGTFKTYAEAWTHKSLLTSPELTGNFIVTVPYENMTEPNRLPLSLPFDTTALDVPEPINGPEYWEAAGLAGNDTANGGAETPLQMETELTENPSGEASNQVRLRLARKYARLGQATRIAELLEEVRESGTVPEQVMADFVAAHADVHAKAREAALEKFLKLANDTSLPPSIRRESMRRGAALFHALQRYPEAWMAYEQIAGTEIDSAGVQEARKDQAGLAYELAGRGKGQWSEVRELCRAAADHHDTSRKNRATADLMYVETLWEEGRYEEALPAFATYQMNYSDIPREAHMAGLWHGAVLWRLGRQGEARAVFERVAESSQSSTDHFAAIDPRANSLGWLKRLAREQGDVTGAAHWDKVLKQEFPIKSTGGRPTVRPHK